MTTGTPDTNSPLSFYMSFTPHPHTFQTVDGKTAGDTAFVADQANDVLGLGIEVFDNFLHPIR